MAAQKKTVRRKTVKKAGYKRPCTPKDICGYLERLDMWLFNDFLPHYNKLTNAVCNLDRVAIRKMPNIPAAMLCPGSGVGLEPPLVPPPYH